MNVTSALYFLFIATIIIYSWNFLGISFVQRCPSIFLVGNEAHQEINMIVHTKAKRLALQNKFHYALV